MTQTGDAGAGRQRADAIEDVYTEGPGGMLRARGSEHAAPALPALGCQHHEATMCPACRETLTTEQVFEHYAQLAVVGCATIAQWYECGQTYGFEEWLDALEAIVREQDVNTRSKPPGRV